MTFSQYAGTAIVPTLARLVLAAVFVSTGWNKVKDRDFSPADATRLKRLGVSVEEVRPIAGLSPDYANPIGPRIAFASYITQAPGQAPGDAPVSDTQPAVEPAGQVKPADDTSASQAAPPATGGTIEPLPPGQYRALGMYNIALMLEDAKLSPQMCIWGARLVAFTELLGGAMLLLGLFSRLWGLGLAIAMAGAFYLITMKTNGIFDMSPFVFAQKAERFNTACAQLSLFVLAFGVFLTGAGPLSIDRILFGSSSAEEPGISEA